MAQRGQAVQWWLLGSAALMVIGAFGPWAKALGVSVSGTDGSNDGWLVVAAAVIGGALFWGTRVQRYGAMWGLLGGVAGAGITLYDRSNIQNAINQAGPLGRALAQVGWGLNLDLLASISMAVAAIVYLVQRGNAETAVAQTPPFAPPPIEPPLAPTPPPD